MKNKNESTPRVAVLGCGYWGKNLVRNFAELGSLVAVSDDNRETADRFAEQHAVKNSTIDEILEDASIDGVVIATPAETHAFLVDKVLSSNKHVFVEKPIALQVEQAYKLRDKAKEATKILMVGHLLQYHPVFLKLKGMVRNGELGRLQHIYSHRLNFGKVRREENILWSFAPHDISMILSLIGTEPEKVAAIGSYFLHNKIADVTTTHLSFPGGEEAHVFVSWLHPYKEQKLVIVGDEAMAVFDDTQIWEKKLLIYPHKIHWKNGMPVPNKADATPITVEQAEPLREEAKHFLDCIAGNSVCRTDSEEAIRVLKVLQASEKAIVELRSIDMKKYYSKEKSVNDFFVHESAYVDSGCQIGNGTKIWHYSHILSGTKIGKGCIFGQNVMVGPDVEIGDNCKVQNNVSIYKGVILEDGVFCGPSCVFTNVNNPRAEIERKNEFRKTIVKKGATIGANATIVCGNILGEYSFIAAGAVVTKDVPPYALMAGVPARQIGWVSNEGEILDEKLICPRSGQEYALVNNRLEKK